MWRRVEHPHAGFIKDRLTILLARANPAHVNGHQNVAAPNHATPPPPSERFVQLANHARGAERELLRRTPRGQV